MCSQVIKIKFENVICWSFQLSWVGADLPVRKIAVWEITEGELPQSSKNCAPKFDLVQASFFTHYKQSSYDLSMLANPFLRATIRWNPFGESAANLLAASDSHPADLRTLGVGRCWTATEKVSNSRARKVMVPGFFICSFMFLFFLHCTKSESNLVTDDICSLRTACADCATMLHKARRFGRQNLRQIGAARNILCSTQQHFFFRSFVSLAIDSKKWSRTNSWIAEEHLTSGTSWNLCCRAQICLEVSNQSGYSAMELYIKIY